MEYWDTDIHDLGITTEPVGSPGFFRELDEYRYEKLAYLPGLIDSTAQPGRTVLEVGCGGGTDLARFARAGALVTGIDLSSNAINLARDNISHRGLQADLSIMDGEQLGFPDDTFHFVYAHGVLQYAPRPHLMIAEIHRVLRPGGISILMVYNRLSWLNALSSLTRVPLENSDAPVFRKLTSREFSQLLEPFDHYQLRFERFPVPTRLHRGVRAFLYNQVFVALFQRIPRAAAKHLGWHLIALGYKESALEADPLAPN